MIYRVFETNFHKRYCNVYAQTLPPSSSLRTEYRKTQTLMLIRNTSLVYRNQSKRKVPMPVLQKQIPFLFYYCIPASARRLKSAVLVYPLRLHILNARRCSNNFEENYVLFTKNVCGEHRNSMYALHTKNYGY